MKVNFNWRAMLALLHDVLAAAAVWCAAYWLRFYPDMSAELIRDMGLMMLWVVPLQAAVFVAFGLYRGLWRFASLPDLQRIVLAVSVAAVLVPLILIMFRIQAVVPRSVLILDPLLLILAMGGSRFAYRAWKEHRLYGLFTTLGQPVIVVGAGEAGARLAKELTRSRDWRVVGFLDDDPAKQGRFVHNTKVLGPIEQLSLWCKQLSVDQVIMALPSASGPLRRRIAQACAVAGVKTLTVPTYDDLISGKLTIGRLREIEPEDLLGREPVVLDDAQLTAWLAGKTVLVTGAGGSIGSELCRQIARFNPRQLVLFESSEYALYQIEQSLREDFADLSLLCLVGDVKNRMRAGQILQIATPDIVFHAAAYKHVPLMEEYNAWEAVQNNALGTYVIASEAVSAGIEKFVLISTDKAVNPTNVMGASKRLAEILCQSLQNGKTRFVVVRFGNVLGSAGSVIPKFREQIVRGGPVTVTHPEITRYFMSIQEASQLVLQAGLMGQGGEILVLEMGEPLRIADLAREMIQLAGRNPDDIKIHYVGLRPGEKLYEEPLADTEKTLPTPHPKLRVALPRPYDMKHIPRLIAWLLQRNSPDDDAVRSALIRWIPEYQPSQSMHKPAHIQLPTLH